MSFGNNSYQINDLQALQSRAGAKITRAIQSASTKTGVDFSYLLQQANVESSFKASAKAKSSSATGLFQFIDSTWLSMVKKYGDKYGLGNLADKISESGRVASNAVKNQILALRKDPHIASYMAAEYARENQDFLQGRVGGDIGSTELYMAHFMGPGGAAKFLEALNANPNAKGTALFAREARANPGVFYNQNGAPRSLSEIYAFFDRKFIDSTESTTSSQYAAVDTSVRNSGSTEIFDEKSGRWVKPKINNSDEQLASAAHFARPVVKTQPVSHHIANQGGIGYQNLMVNPVDIMALLDYGQSEDNIWRS